MDEIQNFYKVKAGKAVFLMPSRPKDSRVLDRDVEETEARMEKGTRGPVPYNDPFAMATAAMIERGCSGGDPTGPPWGEGDFAKNPPGRCTAARDELAETIAARMRGDSKGKESKTTTAEAKPTKTTSASRAASRQRMSLPMAAMLKAVDDLTFEQDVRNILKNGCGCTENLDIEKVGDKLATLMSAAAGWAMSGDMTRGRDDHVNREWELHHRERQEREQREEDRRRDRKNRRVRKSQNFLDLYNDALIEEVTIGGDFLIMKDHSMVPPRQGLMWDPVKHRWTRPENVGRTVTEVQGSKRFRAVGTGAHERSVGGHGSGAVRAVQSGRKFRGTTDVGHARPHETSHPAIRGLKGGKTIRRQGHKNAALSMLREHRRRQKRRKTNGKK